MAVSASRLARRVCRPSWPDCEVALGSSAALRRRIAEGGRDVAFVLEPIQRAVERPDRQCPAGPALDLQPDRHAVRLVAEPEDGEQDDLLEFA